MINIVSLSMHDGKPTELLKVLLSSSRGRMFASRVWQIHQYRQRKLMKAMLETAELDTSIDIEAYKLKGT